jgi:hypothetical protein
MPSNRLMSAMANPEIYARKGISGSKRFPVRSLLSSGRNESRTMSLATFDASELSGQAIGGHHVTRRYG